MCTDKFENQFEKRNGEKQRLILLKVFVSLFLLLLFVLPVFIFTVVGKCVVKFLLSSSCFYPFGARACLYFWSFASQ